MAGLRRIAVGSDMPHPRADEVRSHLAGRGITLVRVGSADTDEMPWPDVGEGVGRLVAQGAVDSGVVCCWTGTGVSIAANKVPGVRAALCGDAETARGARRWNDANVLALALSGTGNVGEILDAWLDSDGVDPAEAANIARISELERRHPAG